MKVLLTKPFFKEDVDYIKAHINPEIEIIEPRDYDLATLISYSKDVEVLLGPNTEIELLRNSPLVKLIQIPWTGIDKINLENLKGFDITICNSHSNSRAVAEHSVALALALLKKIPYHHNQLKNGNWNRPKINTSSKITPFSVSIRGLKVGLLGYGSIASQIHKMLIGFECDFFICSKSQKYFEPIDRVVNVFSINELNNFLSTINILFVCLPLTDDTKQLLNISNLVQLKEGYLINTSRGEIINEEDLYNLLAKNEIKGAAIDTWSNGVKEGNLPSKFSFEKLDNVVLSPHRAGMIESALPHLDDVITNINNLYFGNSLINKVSLSKKY